VRLPVLMACREPWECYWLATLAGSQYTGLSVAKTMIGLIPEAQIDNSTAGTEEAEPPLLSSPLSAGSCGDPPATHNQKVSQSPPRARCRTYTQCQSSVGGLMR